MAARDSTSRKGSGASYASKQPRDLVFFTDKCLGHIVVPDAIRAIGERVERMTDHFEEDTEDTKWLAEVGRKGWIVLSKDKNLRHNHIEIVALLKSNTYSFILTSGNFSGAEMAHAFVTAMRDIKGIIATTPPPLVATVTKMGSVKIAFTHSGLIKKISDAKR